MEKVLMREVRPDGEANCLLRFYLISTPLYNGRGDKVCGGYGVEAACISEDGTDVRRVDFVDRDELRVRGLIDLLAENEVMPIHLESVLRDIFGQPG